MILDTSILVDLLRGDPEAVRQVRDLEEKHEVLWLPTPALFELWEGVERADRPSEERERIGAVTAAYTVLEFSGRHAARAGAVSGALARRGQMIDPVDAQIAGVALEEQVPVLTRNLKHFNRVSGLECVEY